MRCNSKDNVKYKQGRSRADGRFDASRKREAWPEYFEKTLKLLAPLKLS